LAKAICNDPPINSQRSEVVALGQLDRHLGYFLRRLQLWVFDDFISRRSSP